MVIYVRACAFLVAEPSRILGWLAGWLVLAHRSDGRGRRLGGRRGQGKRVKTTLHLSVRQAGTHFVRSLARGLQWFKSSDLFFAVDLVRNREHANPPSIDDGPLIVFSMPDRRGTPQI